MLNQDDMTSLFSVTYLEDYLDSVVNLPEDIQRSLSRMRALDIAYSNYMAEVEAAMDEFLEAVELGVPSPVREFVKDNLQRAQEVKDEQMSIVENVKADVDNKTKQLEVDMKNLTTIDKPQDGVQKKSNIEPGVKTRAIGVAELENKGMFLPWKYTPERFQASSAIMDEDVASGTCIRRTRNSLWIRPFATSSVVSKDEAQDEDTRHFQSPKPKRGLKRGRKDADPGDGSRCSDQIANNFADACIAASVANVMAIAATKEPVKKVSTGQKRGRKKKATNLDEIDDEPIYCICEEVSHGDMIQCENDLCPIEWFHFSCVNLKREPKGSWFCPKCRGESAKVMKPRAVLMKELEEYNRQQEMKA